MKPKVVAEIGCNHQGNIDQAKRLIDAAAHAGADYAKFQKRDCEYHKEHNDDWNKAHPNGANAFGNTYYEHRKALEFTIDQHADLKEYCSSVGIGYACSVWDSNSAQQMIDLDPDYIKVPSALNTNEDLINSLIIQYKGDMHISLGMTTEQEKALLFDTCKPYRNHVVFYHCTSGYPVPFDEIYLREIENLIGQGWTVGFSGHHLGIAVDVAALALGACWFERHFTLDRTMKGTDHAASLEPGGLAKLVRDLEHASLSLEFKTSEISPIEIEQRRKLKWQA